MTVIVIWNGPDHMQYALWDSGEFQARIGGKRPTSWEPRGTISLPAGYKKLDRKLTEAGFRLAYRDGRVGLGPFVGNLFPADPIPRDKEKAK